MNKYEIDELWVSTSKGVNRILPIREMPTPHLKNIVNKFYTIEKGVLYLRHLVDVNLRARLSSVLTEYVKRPESPYEVCAYCHKYVVSGNVHFPCSQLYPAFGAEANKRLSEVNTIKEKIILRLKVTISDLNEHAARTNLNGFAVNELIRILRDEIHTLERI